MKGFPVLLQLSAVGTASPSAIFAKKPIQVCEPSLSASVSPLQGSSAPRPRGGAVRTESVPAHCQEPSSQAAGEALPSSDCTSPGRGRQDRTRWWQSQKLAPGGCPWPLEAVPSRIMSLTAAQTWLVPWEHLLFLSRSSMLQASSLRC